MSTTTGARPARRRGPRRSFAGLLTALLPVLAVLVLMVWWQRGEPQPVAEMDPTADIAEARRVSPVPLPAPAGLPAGWRPTSSRVEVPMTEGAGPVTFAIGYLTPADAFAQVVVSDQPALELLPAWAAGATPEDAMPGDPPGWDRYRTDRDEPVLVGRVGRATVLVTGTAAAADLVLLARSVR